MTARHRSGIPLPFVGLLTAGLLLSACAPNAPSRDTVRICDATGCAERSRDYASFDSGAVVPDEDPTGQIAELQEIAGKDPRAAYDLGLRYFRGDGVTQNSYQAIVWMRKAAEGGDFDAQKALGRFYLTGLEEMGSDPQEAERWLSIAAGRGDKESAKLLAEASAARQSDQEYYEWQKRHRQTLDDEWRRAYPYRGYWQQGAWYWH